MALRIYGNLRSSTFRVVWAAEELDLDYTLVPVATAATDAALLALNANGKIPVVDDDGLVLWESMAINLHLARREGGPLGPTGAAEDARMQMWSFWVTGECLTDAFAILAHRVLLAPARRAPDVADAAWQRLQRPLGVIDRHLEVEGHLVGGRFTIADLNVASVLGWLTAAGQSLAPHGHLVHWLARCAERPAARRCQAMAASE